MGISLHSPPEVSELVRSSETGQHIGEVPGSAAPAASVCFLRMPMKATMSAEDRRGTSAVVGVAATIRQAAQAASPRSDEACGTTHRCEGKTC